MTEKSLLFQDQHDLKELRALVDAAPARLAELEAGFTIEKAKVEAMKARLFARLRRRWMALRRHVADLEKELTRLESEAREIEELTGDAAAGIG